MKVLVVDDEQPARERLKSLLNQFPDVVLCGEADNGVDALQIAQQRHPDVVLMDIRMPHMTGLEAARHLNQVEMPPALIFTTAYDDYAIAAFDAKAVAYLLKPVRQENLRQALTNAQTLNRAQLNTLQQSQDKDSNVLTEKRSHLSARLGNRLEVIPINEVIYLQAQQKYVVARHSHGELIIEESLKSLETEFATLFIRVHRNALAAIAYIAGMEKKPLGGYEIVLQNGPIEQRLEVSRRHVATVRKLIKSL